jgi:SAM-dependent methyltransferase
MEEGEMETSKATTPQGIFELAAGFMRSRVFLTACQLELFTQLGDVERGSAEVARSLGADARATDRLMNALVALGLLTKREGRFANGPEAARFLVRGRSEFMGGLDHWAHLWDGWGTLTAAVRAGGSVSSGPVGERSTEWLEAFIAAMHWRACQHAPAVVAALDLAGVSRVLDVGGGSGAYAAAFARAKPALQAVIFDLPAVLPITARYVEGSGMAGRIRLVSGDYDRDPLGEGFDLVLLSAILHSNGPAANRALLAKAAASLRPAGQVVVQDFLVDDSRTEPAFGVLFALNMLVGTPAGDTYTEAEVRVWMAAAGLGEIQRQDMPFGTSLLVGRSTAAH